MAITKTQTPYEFLIRWKDGKIAGAHVKFLERLIDDDGVTVLSEKEGMAIPVSMAGESGYPIADIFTAISSTSVTTAQAAIVAATEAQAETAAHEAAKAASEQAKKAAEDAKAEADAAVAASEAAKQAAADAKAQADAALAAQAEAVRLAVEKASTIPTISKAQGREQLKIEKLLLDVEQYMASLSVDDPVRMAYEDRLEWVRTDQNIIGMMKILGKSDAEGDAFFANAAKL